MPVKFICEGCGKEEPGYYNGRNWFKPSSWFARNAEDGKTEVLACSRECIKKADKKRGESVTIMPI